MAAAAMTIESDVAGWGLLVIAQGCELFCLQRASLPDPERTPSASAPAPDSSCSSRPDVSPTRCRPGWRTA
jgi:hypothetical protein